tara:strand:+ start:305 stop:454 length:150 start_codon:yes stop_codon:yes gene_type:complete
MGQAVIIEISRLQVNPPKAGGEIQNLKLLLLSEEQCHLAREVLTIIDEI